MKLQGIAKDHRPIVKVLEWVGLILLMFIIVVGIWSIIWGGRTDTIALKWLQLFQSIGLFLLPALCAAYLWSDKPWHYIHYDSLPDWKEAVLVVCVMIVAVPGINLLSYLNQQMTLPSFLSGIEALMKQQEEAATALLERFLQVENIGDLTLNVLLMALVPALCEETCFRGILQRFFCDNELAADHKITRQQHIAIWVTACIFSFIHFQFYGFIPRLLLGAVLGYFLLWTGSLWTAVLAHFTNNACSIVLYYIAYNNGDIDMEEIDALGSGPTLWLGIISILLVVCYLTIYHRKKTSV